MGKLDLSKVNEVYNPLLIYRELLEKSLVPPDPADFFPDMPKREDIIRSFMSSIEAGQFENIALVGNGSRPKSTDYLQYYYHCLAPEDRYRVTIDCYVGDGYNFPRELIIGLKNIKPKDRLKDMGLLDVDAPITVYRASCTPPSEDIKNEVSWTVDKDVALFFYCKPRVVSKRKTHLYQALISPCDIIAYTNERGEAEVIQHNDVKSIQEIDPCMSTKECKAFLDEREALIAHA